MPVLIASLVIVGGSVATALAGMLLVRRRVPLHTLREHNEVAGFIIGVVGVAYAVLLAFVALTVWEQFQEAKQFAAREANALASVFRLAQGFSGSTRGRMLRITHDYATTVIADEWPRIGRGARSVHSPRAEQFLDGLWQATRETDPRTPREQALYSEILSQVVELGGERKLRLLAARDGVPDLLWVVLIVGAVVTVSFTYFFGVKDLLAQALMVGALSGTIALNLFLIAELDYPYTGDLRVTPEAMEQVVGIIDEQRGGR